MQISEILEAERVVCKLDSASKKSALEAMSKLLASHAETESATSIFDALIQREKLGSTGLGHGVAIPHGRVESLTKTVGAFIQLTDGVDFDSPDKQTVDLIFGLLVPKETTDEHLELLSRLAELFSESSVLEELRNTESADKIFVTLTQ